MHHCDAMIWSSPTYHGSVSGSFKNALDWLILLAEYDPPYLSNKPIGLISTAGGIQGLQAINSMEFIARALRGWSVPLVQAVPQSWRSFDPEGHLEDETMAAQCVRSAPRYSARPASSRPKAAATTPTTGSSPGLDTQAAADDLLHDLGGAAEDRLHPAVQVQARAPGTPACSRIPRATARSGPRPGCTARCSTT